MPRFPRALLFLPASLMASPAYGQALDSGPNLESYVVAGAALSGAILGPLAFWFWRKQTEADENRRSMRRDLDRVEEMLTLAPDGYICWRYGANPEEPPEEICSRRLSVLLGLYRGVESSLDDVLDRFTINAATALTSAVERLKAGGVGFEVELTMKEDGRRILATGVRAGLIEDEPLADVVWMRDVTADAAVVGGYARAKTQLETEVGRLKGELNVLPMPVWLRDDTLALTDCNRAYARAVGADGPEAVVTQGLELASGDSVKESRAVASRARAAGEPRAIRLHMIISGERRYMEVTEFPLIDARTGEAAATAGVALDITRVEEAEESLDRHIAAHAQVLENLPTAMANFGANERLTFFNKAFAGLWRLNEDWLATEPDYGAFIEALREKRMLPEVADFPKFKAAELGRFTSLLEPQDDLLHLPDNTTLLRSLSPHPLGGLLITYEDVTDLLSLESSYNTLIAVQRETLDHLNEAVAVFGDDGRLKLTNPAFGRLWRLNALDMTEQTHLSEILDKQRRFFQNVEDWPAFKAQMLAIASGRKPQNGRLSRSDQVILDYQSIPLPDGGVLLAYEDVSDTARVERALVERNEALSAINKLKSQFIANVSHELRTPLTTLIGFSEMLNQGMVGEMTPQQKDYAEGVLETSTQLAALIKDIVDLASIEAGDMALELDAFDLYAMATDLVGLVQERAKSKEIALSFDCPPDIGWMVGDEKRIRQALFNVLSNAMTFASPRSGGEGGTVRFAVAAEGPDIVFTVEDNGVGIPEADQDSVFDPFAKGGPSGVRSLGSGLGLSVVKSFMELHGGAVALQSKAGQGAIVTCRVPAGAGGAGGQLPLPTSAPSPRSEPGTEDQTAAKPPRVRKRSRKKKSET